MSEADQRMTQQRANDLAHLNVDIELFPMPKNEAIQNSQGGFNPPKFDIKKFYSNVISIDEDEIGYADELLGIDGAQSRIFELMRRIRQKEFKRRA